MIDYIAAFLVFVVGLAMGSFANVCIYRLPRKLSIVKPRSQCPSCRIAIRALDNIPIISFIFLRGRCRRCGAKISWRYPLVEFLAGILFVLAFYDLYIRQDNLYMFLVSLYLSLVFLMIFFIDIDFKIIPDSLTLPGLAVGLAVSFLPNVRPDIIGSLIGLVFGGALFLVIAEVGDRIFKKESMGGGDIKLAAMMGAFVGWKNMLLVLGLASFLGAVVGVTLLMLAKDKRSARTIPFGPFLVSAGLIVFYRGDQIIAWYLNFLGR